MRYATSFTLLLLLAAAPAFGSTPINDAGGTGSFPPLGFRPLPAHIAEQLMIPLVRDRTVPPTMDWRDAGVITLPKNQLNCGGCWAFAATDLLEAMAIMYGADPITTDFSEQFPLSCDVEEFMGVTNDGCCGGTATVFEFLKNNYELHEADFRFANGDHGGTRTCTGGGSVTIELVPCPDPYPTPHRGRF